MKDNKKQDDVEMLDFDDDTSFEETEVLDFNADVKIANQIDEMLDFIDVNDGKKEIDKIELDASKEKLDEYKPSIKDFNIKSAKTRKIVKKSMLYVIILMLIGFEFFVNKTGDALNSLKVYASNTEPIRIVQNEKYGYISYTGDKIVNPKYVYAENFVKGYAIVKNTSNLPLIIDKGGKQAASSGTYFSLYRVNTDIIASKVTKSGLKYGVLDANLKEKVSFVYDLISYKDGVYTYVKGNTVGFINEKGKAVFKYKLTDKDDKTIEITQSPVTNSNYQRYGVVKINSSSQIVNLKDGKVVSSPTLNEITPEENNVFYETTSNGTKTYMYVQDNKVLLESENYTSLSIPSIETGVLKAITNNYKYEYISTKSLEQLKKNLSEQETYYGDGIFMYEDHNYKSNKDNLVLVKNGEAFKTIAFDFDVYKPYKNGFAIIKYKDGTYGYLNSDGEIINDVHYVEAQEFDSYGDAIAKTNDGYGVINKNGRIMIDFTNDEIKQASAEVKKASKNNINNVFWAAKKDNKYTLYNNNGKPVNKKRYNDVSFDPKYLIVKVSTDLDDELLTTENLAKINLTSFNSDYEAYENYIMVKNEYYNYNGKLIYVDNTKETR